MVLFYFWIFSTIYNDSDIVSYEPKKGQKEIIIKKCWWLLYVQTQHKHFKILSWDIQRIKHLETLIFNKQTNKNRNQLNSLHNNILVRQWVKHFFNALTLQTLLSKRTFTGNHSSSLALRTASLFWSSFTLWLVGMSTIVIHRCFFIPVNTVDIVLRFDMMVMFYFS